MPNAQISQPPGIQVGNFSIPLSLPEAVSGLTNANLNATAVDGNGITGVVFAVMGRGANYNITVTLPAAVTGRFRLALQGSVTVTSSGVTEALESDTITIQYDTASVVTATWGDIDYGYDGVVTLPIMFGEGIELLHKSDFTIETVVERNDAGEVKYSQPAGLVSDVSVNALISLVLQPFQGVGPITIKNSKVGAGVYEVVGTDEKGTPQTEELTFAADDSPDANGSVAKTTVNNYVDGLRIRVTTAFPGTSEADATKAEIVRVDAVPIVWEVIERYWLSQDTRNGNLVNPRTFKLHFQLLPDIIGAFTVDLTGYVYKTASTIRDDVQIAAKQVRYDTTVPQVTNQRIFRDFQTGRVDWVVQYNTPCTLNDPILALGHADAQPGDFLDYTQSDLDNPPNIYRKMGDTSDDFPSEPLNEDLDAEVWTMDGRMIEEGNDLSAPVYGCS